MKKILFLITSGGWGGAERYVVRLAKSATAEFDVSVMSGCSAADGLLAKLPAGARGIELPLLTRDISPVNDLRAMFAVRAFIDREGIDLVHCNSTKAGLIGALAAALARRRPKVVYTAHGWAFSERRGFFFRHLMLWSERLASRFRSATIVLSEREREVALRHHLATATNVRVIPHGIDPDEIDFLTREKAREEIARIAEIRARSQALLGSQAPPALIGAIANAYPAKALPLLIDAFSLAFGNKEAEPGTQASQAPLLVIFGDGPDMELVKAARERSRIKDSVFLPGAVPDAARLLKGLDLFVLPSTKEGMPWVILEASLAGVPILAARVGAVPDMTLDGVSGELVAPGDIAALAAAMRRLMTDAARLNVLKSKADDIAARYSASKMIAATLDLYRDLLSR
jgi:glycosyltransferase involved in cell wall biosynthesis